MDAGDSRFGHTRKRAGHGAHTARKRGWALDHLAQSALRVTSALRVEHLEEFGFSIIAFGGLKQRLEKPPWRFFGRRRVQVQATCREDFGHVAPKSAHLLT